MNKGIKCKLCGERGCRHMEPVLAAIPPPEVVSGRTVTPPNLHVTMDTSTVTVEVRTVTRNRKWEADHVVEVREQARLRMQRRRAKA